MSRFQLLAALILSLGILAGQSGAELPSVQRNILPDADADFSGFPRDTLEPLPFQGDRDLHEGFPVFLNAPGAGFPYTPTLQDVDGDGADEIFLTGGHTFGLRGDGTFLPGWPTSEMTYMGYGTNANKPGPSVWDIEDDGESEILWTTRDWWAGNSHLWCFNGKNVDGSDLPGFPQYAPDDYSNALDTPFVLGDTDGDGDFEAWGPHTLGNAFIYYRLSGFDHLGNLLFTTDLNPAESILCLYFGDLDGSGDEEMFAVSWLSPSLYVHVFEADGTEAPGYPILFHSFSSGYLPFGPPVPADLDDDGDLEILFGHWGGGYSEVHCLHHDGSPYPGFPIAIATDSQLFYFGLGDVSTDGEPELIAFDNQLSADYRIHVFDIASGTLLPGWPYHVADWPKGFPTVVDVDDDGRQDICLATEGGELLALSGDGQLLAGYPKNMVSPSISGVAAGDIDDDGLFELVAATWDGWVYAWDTIGRVLPGRADWPLRGVDPRNTGVFEKSVLTAVKPIESAFAASTLRVSPNPVRSRASFHLEPVAGATSLMIYDVKGRLVEELATQGRERLSWQPEPALASGVYFAKSKGENGSAMTRFVLLH